MFQAANRRIIMPNAYMMLHFGSEDYTGSHLDVQNWAKYSREHAVDILLGIYTQQAIKGPFFKGKYVGDKESRITSYIKRKLKEGDWYMTADEAVHYGFADAVMSNRLKI